MPVATANKRQCRRRGRHLPKKRTRSSLLNGGAFSARAQHSLGFATTSLKALLPNAEGSIVRLAEVKNRGPLCRSPHSARTVTAPESFLVSRVVHQLPVITRGHRNTHTFLRELLAHGASAYTPCQAYPLGNYRPQRPIMPFH